MIFLTTFVLFQIAAILILLWHIGHFPDVSDITSDFLIFGFLFTFEAAVLAAGGIVFFGIPVANVFWASVLPSAWLWVYILSALIARSLLAFRVALRLAVRVFDFDDHPIRSLGILAGAVIGGLCAAVITALYLG